MSDGDNFFIRDKQVMQDQDMMNVYYFRQENGSDGAQALAEAFEQVILPNIVAIQHSSVTHTEIEVINVFDEEDFYSLALTSGNVGERTGEVLPRFNAWGFTILRATRLVRNGSKRIAGIAEGDILNGVPAGGFLSTLNGYADALAATLEDSNGNAWDLKIPKGPWVGATVPLAMPISGVIFAQATTQNSRKR